MKNNIKAILFDIDGILITGKKNIDTAKSLGIESHLCDDINNLEKLKLYV